MNLSELLEFTAAQYLDDASGMVSGEPDNIWPPAALVRWFNMAQSILCRRAWVLDSVHNSELGAAATADNDSVTKIVLVDGVRDYAVSKKIMFVKSIHLDDTEIDLIKVDYAEIHPAALQFINEDYFDVNNPYTETPGRPQWWAPNTKYQVVRFRPVPDAVAIAQAPTALMRTVHLPIHDLKLDDLDAEPEVPEQFHEHLCTYAAGMALMNPNVDIGKAGRSQGKDYLAMWNQIVAEAKQERIRWEQAPFRFQFGRWAHDSRT